MLSVVSLFIVTHRCICDCSIILFVLRNIHLHCLYPVVSSSELLRLHLLSLCVCLLVQVHLHLHITIILRRMHAHRPYCLPINCIVHCPLHTYLLDFHLARSVHMDVIVAVIFATFIRHVIWSVRRCAIIPFRGLRPCP